MNPKYLADKLIEEAYAEAVAMIGELTQHEQAILRVGT